MLRMMIQFGDKEEGFGQLVGVSQVRSDLESKVQRYSQWIQAPMLNGQTCSNSEANADYRR